jgi:hypothetical protein
MSISVMDLSAVDKGLVAKTLGCIAMRATCMKAENPIKHKSVGGAQEFHTG